MNKLDKNGRSRTKIVIKLDKTMNKSDKNCDQVGQNM